jgi:hypothetical protein
VYALYKAFGDSTSAADAQTAAFYAQVDAAKALADAHRGLLAAELSAGGRGLKTALDRMGPGLTEEAKGRIIRLSAQREQAAAEQAAAIQRETRAAGGLVPITDLEKQRIDALQGVRDKLVEEGEKRKEGSLDFELSDKERAAMRTRAQAYQTQIEAIQKEATRAFARGFNDLDVATQKLVDLDKQLNAMGVGPNSGRPGPAPRKATPAPREVRDPTDAEIYSQIYGGVSGYEGIKYQHPKPQMDPTRGNFPGKASFDAMRPPSAAEKPPPSVFASLTACDEREQWRKDQAEVSAGMRAIYDQSAQSAA